MPRGKFATPCLVCGVLTVGSNRCPQHQAEMNARSIARLKHLPKSENKRDKYKGDYSRRAKEVKRIALEQNAPCALCGLPLTTGGQIHADHIYPELGVDSPLQAVHAACNIKKGNRPHTPRS